MLWTSRTVKADDIHPQGDKRVMRLLYEHGVLAIFSTLDPQVLQFKPGILIGRQLMEAVSNIDAAQKMAADLAGHLQRSGVGGGAQLSPGVLVQGGHIILGYFPMDQVFEVPGAGG